MKAVIGVISIVSALFVPQIIRAAEPARLDPDVKQSVATWESNDFKFQLETSCRVDFNGLFTKRYCKPYISVTSKLRFNDQRSNSYAQGEREIRETDMSFKVDGKPIYTPSFSYVHGSKEELLRALINAPKSTVEITYPVGTIKDGLFMLNSALSSRSYNRQARTKSSSDNQYRTASFQLSGIVDAAAETRNHAINVAQREVVKTNTILAIIYGLAVVLTITAIRRIKKLTVKGAKKTAAKLEESFQERRIENEKKSLHIREEAYRRYEAEKIKQWIQDALAEDDHAKAQELMTKLRKTLGD